MTILELFRGGPPGKINQNYCLELLLASIFWQGGCTILVVSLGVTTPIITPVTFSKGAC